MPDITNVPIQTETRQQHESASSRQLQTAQQIQSRAVDRSSSVAARELSTGAKFENLSNGNDFVFETAIAKAVQPSFDDESLYQAMDEVESELVDESLTSEIIVGSAVVVATGFSLAQIAWILRASALMTKAMTSIPIWVSFDPLPLLNRPRPLADDAASSETLLDIANAKS